MRTYLTPAVPHAAASRVRTARDAPGVAAGVAISAHRPCALWGSLGAELLSESSARATLTTAQRTAYRRHPLYAASGCRISLCARALWFSLSRHLSDTQLESPGSSSAASPVSPPVSPDRLHQLALFTPSPTAAAAGPPPLHRGPVAGPAHLLRRLPQRRHPHERIQRSPAAHRTRGRAGPAEP